MYSGDQKCSAKSLCLCRLRASSPPRKHCHVRVCGLCVHTRTITRHAQCQALTHSRERDSTVHSTSARDTNSCLYVGAALWFSGLQRKVGQEFAPHSFVRLRPLRTGYGESYLRNFLRTYDHALWDATRTRWHYAGAVFFLFSVCVVECISPTVVIFGACWPQSLPLRGSVIPVRFHWYWSQRIPRQFSPESHAV